MAPERRCGLGLRVAGTGASGSPRFLSLFRYNENHAACDFDLVHLPLDANFRTVVVSSPTYRRTS